MSIEVRRQRSGVRRAQWATAIAVVVGCARVAFGQAIPNPPSTRWPNSGGTLSVTAYPSFVFKGVLNGPASSTSASITGDKKAIVAGANAYFGPFSVNLTNGGSAPIYSGTVTQTYTVTIYASSPGQVASSTPLSFTQVGQVTRTLTASLGKKVTSTFTIPVNLTSVFTDVKIVAQFSPGPLGSHPTGPTTVTYPSGSCGSTTPGLNSTTDTCMQGAVNPTGVLVPDVMPISIIYEPPGNCSWSNLTFSSELGTGMGMTQANSTATQVLANYSAAGGLFSSSSNTTQTAGNGTSATFNFSSNTTQAFGTSFGLPLQAPGNPSCNAGIQVGNIANTNGPGIGDQFVFVVQPTFLYWDTNGLTTFRLSTQQAPGTQETMGTAFIRQIDPVRPSLRPSFLANLNGAQLQAVRALDPMAPNHTGKPPTLSSGDPIACTSGASLPASRFVYLGRRCLSAGTSTQASQGTTYDSTTQSTLMSGMQSVMGSSGNQATKNISTIVGAFAGAVSLISGGGTAAFDTFGKVSSAFDMYVVHDSTTTTVTETTTTNTNLSSSQNNSYAQSFFLRDQNREVDLDIYYDSFFGTMAFNPISSCSAPRLGNACYMTKFTAPSYAWGAFYGALGTAIGDVDNDGKKDLIALGSGYIGVIRSIGNTFGSYETWLGSTFAGSHGTLVGDIDGDGRVDIVNLNDSSVTARRSTGSSFGNEETWWAGAFYGSHGTVLGDVDGDGRADLVGFGDGYVGVTRSQVSGFGNYEQWVAGSFYGAHGTFAADVDGDGRADIVGLADGYVGVMRSTGSSFGPYETWSYSSLFGSSSSFLDDVNGDGLADIVMIGTSDVEVALSTGTSFAAPVVWSSGSFVGAAGNLVGDVTGDHRADVVQLNLGNTYEMDAMP